MDQIRLALPKGSLNNPDRGFTQKYFINAGYDIRGYSPSQESNKRVRIANDPEIKVLISRPEDVPLELSNGVVDIAITGEDWVRERTIRNIIP